MKEKMTEENINSREMNPNLISSGIITPRELRRIKTKKAIDKTLVDYLREGESLNMNELSRIIRKIQPLLVLAMNSDAPNSEWRKQLENLRCAAQKLQALIAESEVPAETPSGSRSMTIIETTLRRMIFDYVYKRPQFKAKMEWQSNYSKDRIVVRLEEKPYTQESLGYHLVEEPERETKK